MKQLIQLYSQIVAWFFLLASVVQAANVELVVNWPSYSGENAVQIFDASNTNAVTTPAYTDGTGSSANTSFSGSTTYTLVDGQTYTVRMTDSFGDGWNGGGSVTVNVNGAFVATNGLSSGSSGTFQFTATVPPQPNIGNTICTGTTTAPSTSATLDFADAGVDWPSGVLAPPTFSNIEGKNVDIGISYNAVPGLISLAESSSYPGTGDTAPFALTSGMGAANSLITFDLSANPSAYVDFCIFHINWSGGGGDKVTVTATTDNGTVLTDPTFGVPASPDYIFTGTNVADANAFSSAANGLLGVRFDAPSGEKITSVTLDWEEATLSTNSTHGMGFGNITIDATPPAPTSNGVINYPDSGNGVYPGSIALLDWTTSSLTSAGIQDGAVVNFPLPGCRAGTLAATFSNISNATNAASYRPNDMRTWGGASMFAAYDGPGSGEALYGADGADVTFTVDWSLVVNGSSVVPDMFVFDAESTAGSSESIVATTNGGNWSLIDQARGSGYVVSGIGTQTFTINQSEGPSHSPLLLSMDTTQTTVTINAGGRQAVAFGVLLPCDYADASGYGNPVHAYAEEPALPMGLQFTPGQPYLGSTPPDSEIGTQASGSADGDDADSLGDDEDAIATFPAMAVGASSYTIPAGDITASGTGTLYAWIDFNNDGIFQTTEYTSTAVSGGVLAGDLNFAGFIAPTTVGTTVARFRITTDTLSASDFAAGASNGEVEDHQFPIVAAVPSLQLTKTGGVATISGGANPLITDAGDTIAYTFRVENTGNTVLTNVTVTDPKATMSGGPIASLAVGAVDTATFTASYTITAADLVNGGVENTATATGTPPSGPNVTDTSDTGAGSETTNDPDLGEAGDPSGGTGDDDADPTNDPTVVAITSAPSLKLTKTAGVATIAAGVNPLITDAGDTIAYTFRVENTGNVPLTNVTVTDPKATMSGGPIASLAVGAVDTATFTASYTITATDLVNGGVENTATTTGSSPSGTNDVTDVSDTGAGSETTNDPDLGEPGDPSGNTSDDDVDPTNDPTVVAITSAPSLKLTKTAGAATVVGGLSATQTDAGDTISYTFTVQNTGNVTLTNVMVSDPKATVSGGPIASLAPGASDTSTFTASYTIAVNDFTNGGVENTATTTGSSPSGTNDVTDVSDTGAGSETTNDPDLGESGDPSGNTSDDDVDPTNDPTVVAITSAPSLKLTKTAGVATIAAGANPLITDAGDTIAYTFRVENTGNVPLTNVTVTDPKATMSGGPITSLAVGAVDTATFTAVHTINATDLANGGVENTATVTGSSPAGTNDVTDVSDTGAGSETTNDPDLGEPGDPSGGTGDDDADPTNDPTVVAITPSPSLKLTKTAGAATVAAGTNPSITDAGDTIAYTFTVVNTGNVPLTNVTVTDPKATVTGGPIGTLAIGATDTATFTANYTITAGDLANGGVENTALVTGTPPSGPNVTDVSDTGTGSETTNDPDLGETGDPSGGTGDDDADPTNDPTVFTIAPSPAIQLTKTAGTATIASGANPLITDAGDTISYSFTVANTGNVPLTNVTVTDPKATMSGGPIASLAVGAVDTATFTASYPITATDLINGGVENTATATGSSPSGTNDVTDTSDTGAGSETANDPDLGEAGDPSGGTGDDDADPTNDPTVFTIAPSPVIQLTKTAGTATIAAGANPLITDAGDTIAYTFRVENTGNVPLTNVAVTDPKATMSGGPIASLAVGAVDTATFTASYTITAADLINGGVENTATVTGSSPSGTNDVTDVSDTGAGSEATNDPDLGEAGDLSGGTGDDDVDPTNDPTVVTITPAPSLKLTKTASAATVASGINSSITDVGDTIAYTFRVENTGNVPLTNVTVADGTATMSGGPIASLAPGAVNTVTFTASYTITVADLVNGGVENTATATGTPPSGPNVTDVSDTGAGSETTNDPDLGEAGDPSGGTGDDDADPTNDPTIVNITPAPSILLTKFGSAPTLNLGSNTSITDTGDTIAYTFTVVNTGNVPLTNVTVTDGTATMSGGPVASLAPGASDTTTFTANYTVQAADVANRGVENTALVTGTPPSGPNVTDVSDSGYGTETTNEDDLGEAGDPNGTNPDDTDPTNDPTVVTIPYSELQLSKIAGTPTTALGANPNLTDAGDTIAYTFRVENTGNTVLTNVFVTDPKATVSGGPIASMAIGAVDTGTFTASYTITAADLINRGVENSAIVTGTPPTGPAIFDISDTGLGNEGTNDPDLGEAGDPTGDTTADDADPTNDPTVTIIHVPELVLSKTGGTATIAAGVNPLITDAGDTIAYTFRVENTGNVPLTNVTVTDPKATMSGGPITSLAVGAVDTATFTASYTITAADLVNGGVENTATATGSSPSGTNDVTDVSDTGAGSEATNDPDLGETGDPSGNTADDDADPTNDPTVVMIAPSPALQLTKTGGVATIAAGANPLITDAGDTISYTFRVENTGNVPLTNVTVTDPKATMSGGPITSLAVGAIDTATFTASYTIMAADLINSGVENTATVTGTPPSGPNVTDTSDTGAGSETTNDPDLGEAGDPSGNTADDDVDPTNDPTVVMIAPSASLQLTKTGGVATIAGGSNPLITDAGDTIAYTFRVENTGNVPLTNVTVTDPKATMSGGPITSLAVGAVDTATFTASYTITAADLVNGGVENTATATGTPPSGPNVTDTSDTGAGSETTNDPDLGEAGDPSGGTGDDDVDPTNDPTVVAITPAPSLKLTKTAGTATIAAGVNPLITDAGDTIAYTFRVENTGNVPLTNVTVTDPKATMSGGPITSLAVGAVDTATFTASYTITAADLVNGGVENTATATGSSPSGTNDVTDVSDTGAGSEATNDPDLGETGDPSGNTADDDADPTNDPTVVMIAPSPALQLTKTGGVATIAAGANPLITDAGDTISYTFRVENTGNVPLTNVTVTDPKATMSGGPITSLAVGAIDTATFTASYTIMAADLINSGVENTATVTGTPPSGPNVTDTSDTGAGSETTNDPDLGEAGDPSGNTADDDVDPTNDPTVVMIAPSASLQLTKTGGVATIAGGSNPLITDAGDTIAYTFRVENTGNVPLTNVTVTDPKATMSGGPITSLAVGAVDTATFTAVHTITAADLVNGGVENTATATGTPPSGPNVTDTSDTGAGSETTNDPDLGEAGDPSGGTGDDDVDPTNDPTVVAITPAPSLKLTKTAGTATIAAGVNPLITDAGDTIAYTFRVENTGNVPLTNVTVTDPKATMSGGPITSLAVGAVDTATFTASYTITAADLVNGGVENTATATGSSPSGTNDVTDVSDTGAGSEATNDPDLGETGDPSGNTADDDADPTNDPTVVMIAPSPSIQLTKTAGAATVVGGANPTLTDAGDTISYTFTVLNNGNVPLTNVTISDLKATVLGGPIASLAPGASDTSTFTASYPITVNDFTNGGVENTATVTGTPPSGPAVTDVSDTGAGSETTNDPDLGEPGDPSGGTGDDDADPTNDPTVIALTSAPSIQLTKTAGTATIAAGANPLITDAGDTISYTFRVENTGNVPLTNVSVTDLNATMSGGPITSLAVGAVDTATFTAVHTINATDLANGGVENTATVTGSSPAGTNDVTDVSDTGAGSETTNDPDLGEPGDPSGGTGDDDADPTNDPTVVAITPSPSLKLTKFGSAPTLKFGADPLITDAGDTIAYTFTVVNTGNVPLTNVTVTDGTATMSGGPITSLAPGASDTTTFTANYTVQAADVANRGVENTALVTGTPPSGPNVTDVSDSGYGTETTNENDLGEAGDPNGTNPDDSDPTNDPTVVTIPYSELQLTKFSGTPTIALGANPNLTDVGDTIAYTFQVENTGNTVLTNVFIIDPKATVTGGPIASLAIGAVDTATFTATYTVTAADLINRGVENTATVTGTPPTGPAITDISDTGFGSENTNDPDLGEAGDPTGDTTADDADPTNDPTVTAIQVPEMVLVKFASNALDANGDAVTGNAGDTIDYTLTVTNTGNVTLTNIVVNDPLLGGAVGTIASLIPGASQSVMATYTFVAADVTRGYVENSATATGSSPTGINDVSDISDTGTQPDLSGVPTPASTESPNGTGGTDSDPGNDPTVTTVPLVPSGAAVSGIVYLDQNGNGSFDSSSDPRQSGFNVILKDSAGNVVAQTVSAVDGSYSMAGFPVGSNYSIEFVDPSTGVTVGSLPNLNFGPNTVLANQNQPIDPAGVFYNSATGQPISGVTVELTDASGSPLPAVCLAPGQQPQTSGSNGGYSFDVQAGADPACPLAEMEYLIAITSYPSGYVAAQSTTYPPQSGSLDATTCPIDAIPGGSCQPSASTTAPPAGTTTPYYFSFLLAAGDPDVINNHIPLDPVATTSASGITLSKTATPTTVVIGDTVTYQIQASNATSSTLAGIEIVDNLPSGMVFRPGSATVDGTAVTPTQIGSRLSFSGLMLPANGSITVALSARVTGTAPPGAIVNNADIFDSAGNKLAPTASATVRRRVEHTFDCSDIIGKVFDDKNHNGYQDGTFSETGTPVGQISEPGLPGVRLATIDGTIITTDKFGRFHVPCAELPANIGSNFYLKLDARSLPTGYRVTTENPRVVRVTRGKFAKVNFGASISNVVDIDLSDRAFVRGKDEPSPRLVDGLKRLVEKMRNEPSVLRISYYVGNENRALVKDRQDEVEELVRRLWKSRGRYKLNIERTIKVMQ